MRLSKRQLKRIIREEYSRLKRRGLISEHKHEVEMADIGQPSRRVQAMEEMNYLKFVVKNIAETAGWETILRNMEMYDKGQFVDYCDECGCSSDNDFVQCALEYAEGMSEREIALFANYIRNYGGRF